MRPVQTVTLLAALLLGTVAEAAPRPLELHATPQRVTDRALRAIPTVPEPLSAYGLVTRWVEDVTLPRPDGRPKLVIRSVRGGLVLGWARLW